MDVECIDSGNVELLVGDGRTREVKRWADWLQHVPTIRQRFIEWSDDFDPFHFNEAASVAVLANAASKADFLAHTEYAALKRHPSRGRPFRNGRCDLWLADPQAGLSWAFEVKQLFAAPKVREGTFWKSLERAYADAKSVDRDEADRRVGCLIMVPRNKEDEQSFSSHFDALCSEADLAYRIGGGRCAIWLAFNFVN